MPIKLPQSLPAADILKKENIFVMDKQRACEQDIRPLEILLLNLMPKKETAEVQLLRLLSNTPLQVNVTLLHLKSHQPKHTCVQHLFKYYTTFSAIKQNKYDGMIITGAPVEHLDFEKVDYWEELKEILAWSNHHITSTFHICWASQAALFYHYGIAKIRKQEKIFGVFSHHVCRSNSLLLRGFDDVFDVPHSRYTDISKKDIEKIDELEILSESQESGIYLCASKDGRKIFASGHAEYDKYTLKEEYLRDIKKGLQVNLPKHYFPQDDPEEEPCVTWRSHAHLLFSNWLNYYVYQETPFDLRELR